jgi:hypothetical protein
LLGFLWINRSFRTLFATLADCGRNDRIYLMMIGQLFCSKAAHIMTLEFFEELIAIRRMNGPAEVGRAAPISI